MVTKKIICYYLSRKYKNIFMYVSPKVQHSTEHLVCQINLLKNMKTR